MPQAVLINNLLKEIVDLKLTKPKCRIYTFSLTAQNSEKS